MPAAVELEVPASPAHVRTARLVAVATARRAGLPEHLLDEVRLAVGEACARAVSLHLLHAPDEPVRMSVTDKDGLLTVVVNDVGPPPAPEPRGWSPASEPADPLVPLVFLSALVDDVTVLPGPRGTAVRLRWPLPVREPSTSVM